MVSGGTTAQGGVSGGGEGASGGAHEVDCTISASSSLATIPTVGVVTFTVSGLAGISTAEIDFGLEATGPTMTAPVDLTQADYRTLLLGMKGSQSYVYRIKVTGSAGTCTSSDYTIRTGDVPDTVPKATLMVLDAGAHAKGFIITSPGLGGGNIVFVVDTDGDPVWWTEAPPSASRAHMSWDGKDMYMMSSEVWKIGMDGQKPHEVLAGFKNPDHDFTAIPNGIAVLDGTNVMGEAVVERMSDGTMTTIVPDLGALYDTSAGFHPNALHYYPWDDSYTLSDLNRSLFVKFTRQGELVWQLGGTNPKDPTKFFAGAPAWQENHGHHLLSDGSFVFFDNQFGSFAKIRALALDTTTMTATESFSHTASCATPWYGDVQHLPNGNYLVTCSNDGQIVEITSSGELVATLKRIVLDSTGRELLHVGKFGYSEFRESLYGAPLY